MPGDAHSTGRRVTTDWRGLGRNTGELGYRLTGSSDLYEDDGRRPHASINFVTCHDGFTLADLVSYNHKHNEANGEGNRDGMPNNLSWNHGIEGPTDDAEIRALRPPEPYKGKGIRYEGEAVKIKDGKAFAGAGAK